MESFLRIIYIYMNSTTLKWHAETPRNGTPKRSEIETFRFNWKNETPAETELTTLGEGVVI
jgi:hypothetical protein